MKFVLRMNVFIVSTKETLKDVRFCHFSGLLDPCFYCVTVDDTAAYFSDGEQAATLSSVKYRGGAAVHVAA